MFIIYFQSNSPCALFDSVFLSLLFIVFDTLVSSFLTLLLPFNSYCAMSFSLCRIVTPARARFAGAAVSAPRVLASSSTRLYSSTKSAFSPQDIHNVSHNPDHIQSKLPTKKLLRNANRFREFDLEDRVFAITGGGRGLGLSMAEALIEAGAKGMQPQ